MKVIEKKEFSNECEEPGCVRPWVKDWHGRKVCADHFDKYRDEDEKSHMDSDEWFQVI